MFRYTSFLFSLLIVLATATPAAESARRPNVIVLLADDMGWSDLGCYGGEISTPHLDRLGQGGVRFTQFHNTAKCFPSRACLLTGLYAQQCGMDQKPRAIQNAVTVGEVLRAAGYRTLMVGKHHGTDNPYDRGFDRYRGLRDGAANYFNPGLQRPGEGVPAQKRPGKRVWCFDDEVLQPYTPEEPDFYSTDYFTNWALEFLDEWKGEYADAGKPFFLYVAYQAPHDPLQAWPEDIAKYRGKYRVGYEAIAAARYKRQRAMSLVDKTFPRAPRTFRDWETLPEEEKADQELRMAVYAAMIDRMDQNIGRVLAKVRDMGEEENTLILFASDNGSSAEVVRRGDGEIGTLTRWASLQRDWACASNTPFRNFKGYSHQGGICTPLIAYWPRGIQAPGRISQWVGHFVDILATLVEVTGVSYPPESAGEGIPPLAGESFLPVLEDREVPRQSPLFWEWSRGKAVRTGRWKLVSWQDKWELFDMTEDRTETRDRSWRRPEIVAQLKSLHRHWRLQSDPVYTTVLDQYRQTDVAARIRIHNRAELEARRRGLAELVFGEPSVPLDARPQEVATDIRDEEYRSLSALRRIDALTYTMDFGLKSQMYYFHAEKPGSTLVIYHQGHMGDFRLGKKTIGGLLEAGHDVIALSMPLLGKNNQPLVNVPHVGRVHLSGHEWMRFLDRPLSFFQRPIAAAIHHGLATDKYARVALVGLSGGGWSVTLYAAMDERVVRTYSVGGTMPFYLRSPVPGAYGGRLGDFEQNFPPLIQAANYLEMYVLGAAGKGRKEMQIINQFDSVAAHGIKYRTFEGTVSDRVLQLADGDPTKGDFSVWLDSTNPRHSISKDALAVILEDLRAAEE